MIRRTFGERMTNDPAFSEIVFEIKSAVCSDLPGEWWETPNPAFEDLRPVDVDANSLLEMLYRLQAGEPD